MSSYYVLTPGPIGGDLDLATLRRLAVADALVRFHRGRGDDVVSPDPPLAPDDAIVTRWAQWLIAKLVDGGLAVQGGDGGWRAKTVDIHAENERRLDGLEGWSKTALKGQRKLLAHVDAPADAGNELEQSLSKLAAAGWNVEAKGDKSKKAEPELYFAAGELPLTTTAEWQDPAAVHPRLAAALAALLLSIPEGDRDGAQPGETDLGSWLPAGQTVVAADAAEPLLDLRTVAKVLRDAGGLELADGEPLGPVTAVAEVRLRTVPTAASNGSAPEDRNAAALLAEHGEDAVRFALLHAAAPDKRFVGGVDLVDYAAGVLGRAKVLADRYLDAAAAGKSIDLGDGLRRRLARWCDTATERAGENFEHAELHRATRNTGVLIERIEDFEAKVGEYRGEVAGADREALAVAVGQLLGLLAPLAPGLVSDLTGSLQQG